MKPYLSTLVGLLLSVNLFAQNPDSVYMHTNYDLTTYRVAMRDGVHLFTIVYTPKDKSKTYPIIINRTCYNASGYTDYKTRRYPSPTKTILLSLRLPSMALLLWRLAI
ncbi:MAG: hypothetical protein IPJ20_21510 [Flammeovirgaceae bacterium]|nr:hypothetical protein [Flammeovirgaceae bacterium]